MRRWKAVASRSGRGRTSTRHLRDGLLIAPFGREWVAGLGGFDIVVAESVARRDTVDAFVAWLRNEVRRDEELTLESTRTVTRSRKQ